jgi:pyruvate kinase
LGDLCGPKIRCNAFGDSPYISLTSGKFVNLVAAPLSNRKYPGNESMIITPIDEIIAQSEPGHRILLDDGYIKLHVVEKKSFSLGGETCPGLVCKVLNDGILKPKKGINVPDLKLNLSALTEKDKRDARYMYSKNLEFVALSFVQRPQDIQDLLDVFKECYEKNPKVESDSGKDWPRPFIIAKIEKPQGKVF